MSKYASLVLSLILVPCVRSSWSPKVDVLDLTATDPALKGFEGGFVDSNKAYGYFIPHNNGAHFGHFARVSLHDFKSVQVLDLSTKDNALKGFKRGFEHRGYGYLAPHYNNGTPSGIATRVDLNHFSIDRVEVLDLTAFDQDLHGFEGGLSDGAYGYFIPHFNGKVPRFNLKGAFSEFSSIVVLDLTTVDPDLRGYDGGFVVHNHIYFCPRWNYQSFGKVVRFDSRYFAKDHVSVLDLNKTDSDLRGFSDCFSDGRFGYFVPRWNEAAFGKVARVDLSSFTNDKVSVLDLASTDHDLKGFGGGFCDEDFAYFVPRWKNEGGPFGKFVRVFLRDFRSSSPRLDVLDLTTIDADLKGFSGAFTDEAFAYLVPFEKENGVQFGKVVRVTLNAGANVTGVAMLCIVALVAITIVIIWRLSMLRNAAASKQDILASESGVELISTATGENCS